jgi:hypothetical protein
MFDALEARTNRAILQKLANATAEIGSGAAFPVIFDAEFRAGMVGVVGMGASSPQLYVSNADVPPDFIGSEIVVRAGADGAPATWLVADRQPDGEQQVGLTLVVLERA